MSSVQDPIRAQLIEARRAQILDAASAVFAEKGFHLATTKEIAKAAGVSEGTIYNYFKNKDDLLVAMIGRMAQVSQLSDQVMQAMAEAEVKQILQLILTNRFEVLERNRTQIQAFLPQVISNPNLRQLFFRTMAAPALNAMGQVLQAMVDDGRARPINPQVAVHAIFAMVMGLAMLDIVGDSLIFDNRDKFAAGILDLLVNGLQPHPAPVKEAL